MSLSSAESEAKTITKCCVEALYVKHLLEHQTARPFKIEVWTDSSSAKAGMQRLGPRRRAKLLEVQTMRVQQLNKISIISLNQLNTLENVADILTKYVPRAVLDKLAGMMGYTFPDEEFKSFKSARASIRIIGIRNWQLLRDCFCSTIERTNRWRMMFTASWTASHLTTAVLVEGC